MRALVIALVLAPALAHADDEIVKGIRLTQGGKVVSERLTAA